MTSLTSVLVGRLTALRQFRWTDCNHLSPQMDLMVGVDCPSLSAQLPEEAQCVNRVTLQYIHRISPSMNTITTIIKE